MVLFSVPLWAEDLPATEDVVVMHFPNAPLDNVLRFYVRLTQRELHIPNEVGGRVELIAETKSTTDAAALIRKTLLERYGIEIRHVGEHRADVVWTENPVFVRAERPPWEKRPVLRSPSQSTEMTESNGERVIKLRR